MAIPVGAIAEGFEAIGGKAAEFGKVFLNQLSEEESRIRLFLSNLCKKPITWLFTLIFAPMIAAAALYKIGRNIKTVSIIQRIRLFVLLTGFLVGLYSAWFASTVLGSVSGFFIIKNIFGTITGLAFLFGTTLSILLIALLQILIVNAACFLFLKLSKPYVIEKVLSENSITFAKQAIHANK